MPRKAKAIVFDSWAVIAYLEGEAADPEEPRFILTVHGSGYKFVG